MANNYEIMQSNSPNLNGFPTDNSPSTQLKYDIVTSKFMTGIENHHKRNAPTSVENDFGLVGAVMQIIVALLVIVGAVVHWIWNRVQYKG